MFASLAIERKLTGEGLVSLCSGEDMTLMRARALVEGNRIEGAESVWRSLNIKRGLSKTVNQSSASVFPFSSERQSLKMLEERAGIAEAYSWGMCALG